MKKLLVILTVVCLNFSCDDGCMEKRDELQAIENHLAILNEQKDVLYNSLIEVGEDDGPETINAMQAIEDELMMIAIEIAITEINIEQFKREYSRCL